MSVSIHSQSFHAPSSLISVRQLSGERAGGAVPSGKQCDRDLMETSFQIAAGGSGEPLAPEDGSRVGAMHTPWGTP
ncbi:hypothetical protein GCM10009548_04140 [Streptomyces malaysiensis subsp. malaysiensis]|nr:hypothetical protein GA0115260_1028916 [Streptomyces sp. MnatMP-M27]